MQVYINIMFL